MPKEHRMLVKVSSENLPAMLEQVGSTCEIGVTDLIFGTYTLEAVTTDVDTGVSIAHFVVHGYRTKQ